MNNNMPRGHGMQSSHEGNHSPSRVVCSSNMLNMLYQHTMWDDTGLKKATYWRAPPIAFHHLWRTHKIWICVMCIWWTVRALSQPFQYLPVLINCSFCFCHFCHWRHFININAVGNSRYIFTLQKKKALLRSLHLLMLAPTLLLETMDDVSLL